MISLQLITTILTAIIKFTHRLTSYQYYSFFVITPFQLSIEVYTMGKWLPVVHTAPCCYALCSFQHYTLQKPKHYGKMSYIRSTHAEDMSLWWYCTLHLYETSLSSMVAIFLATHPHSGHATIQISYLPWWEYSYLTWSSMAEFSYLTPVNISPLKPLLGAIYWNPEYLLYLLLVMIQLSSDIFLFLLSIFLDLIFLVFLFSFSFYWWWRGMWHCGHMTCHMIWGHKA